MSIEKYRNMVNVVDLSGKPLMPTNRCGKVKHLLRSGKAKVYCYEPYTIQLLFQTTNYTQEIVLGVDAGSKHVGISVVNVANNEEIYSEEAELRTDMQDLLSDKRQYRRTRRNHLRYRKPRFNNRVRNTHNSIYLPYSNLSPQSEARNGRGWLAPSVEHKINSHIKLISNLCKIIPISKIIIETASFDLQKIQNPNIQGVEYQQGQRLDFWNVREYVLFRDNHTCQCCYGKSKDKILNVHHIESRKSGGNSPSNLITLCETCHNKYHNNLLSIKFKRQSKSLRNETHMGIMRWELYNRIKDMYKDKKVKYKYGYITKNSRIENKLEKGHRIDARCITGYPTAKPISEYTYSKFVRKNNRSLHKANMLKGGIRKPNKAPYIVLGFRLFDKVLYKDKEAFIFGRRATGYFDLRDLSGNSIHKSAKYSDLKILTYSNTKLTERRIG